MATVIGVVGSVLTIFSFLQDNFNTEDHTTSETKMRVVAGLDGTGDPPLNNAGGDYPDVRLFNENGGFLGGTYDNGYVSSGTAYDVTIQQTVGQQPTYALFTGNTDAICIAYIASTWPFGGKYGWVGSWGRRCGHPWYASGVYIDGKNPDCIWLDSNGDPTPVTAFQVHFPEFNDKGEGYNSNTQYYCDAAPPFNTYTGNDPNTITYWTRKRNALAYPTSSADDLSTRSSAKEPKPVRSTVRGLVDDTRLVKSRIATHSAVELCESPTSAGPDFVSFAEGKFCDMKGRIVWDLCSEALLEQCFDAEAGEVRFGDLARGVVKDYTKVIEWA